ncbi:efflux RND transporter periplasmic adaptor subunit [Hyphococcus sp.]|uniref:efflux RND transporter periplasmic adaptor subunit n=1 Tax=Hyphococcus sp. TaxID=2038636 RepID=UPI0035C76C1D
MRKLFTILGTIGIFVGFAVLVFAMGSLRPKPELQAPEVAPPSVFYTIADSQSVTLDVSAQGEVRPRTDINLTAQVSGQIVSTSDAFVNGGAFEKGDMLIKIEDAPYRAAEAAARARLAQEEAEAALARKDYEELGLEEDPTALTLRIPQLQQARAEYKARKLDLDRTTIRAPFKGRVRERIAGVGQYVAPGAQLGRIFSTDVAEIKLPLTDNDLAKLGVPLAFTESDKEPGPPVYMTATIAGNTHNWVGRLARTEGAIDAATRQVIAIAVLDDPYGAGSDNGTPLAMGLFVEATITGKPYENAIVLPRSALYGRDTVYTIDDDDTLVEHKVAIVSTDRDTITIASGLDEGDRVVTSPLRGAGAGDKVSPANPLEDTPGSINSEEPTPSATASNNTSGE